jgi:UDP-2-acetamido-2,6-beta-L-arabino-hexul-4-ose reductase
MNKTVLVTGAAGFIGKNICLRLEELGNTVIKFTRNEPIAKLEDDLQRCDILIHAAGVNRPCHDGEFFEGNEGLAQIIADRILNNGNGDNNTTNLKKIIYFSSTQAQLENAYGKSKRAVEEIFENLCKISNVSLQIYRLPGVFGKGCKPDYNSVVATFCHKIATDQDVRNDDPKRLVTLAYIDDVITSVIRQINCEKLRYLDVAPTYNVKLGDIESMLRKYQKSKISFEPGDVGQGFPRALYATFMSYKQKKDFKYQVPAHIDARGSFVEFLKTEASGQFSYFTALPGVTRGGHYHHTKSEKFLVLNGVAKFRFENVFSGEKFEFHTSGDKPEVVETIPGWAHNITNVGQNMLIVILWANEKFDTEHPDTIAYDIQ